MKLSNLTDGLQERFGVLAAVRMNCEAGFEAIDCSMFHPECELLNEDPDRLLPEMKKIADAYGVRFNQAHAPFPTYRFGEENEEYNRTVRAEILRSIEIAGALGADHIILHPVAVPHATADEQLAFNLELFGEFVDAAHRNRVGIALENMWGRHRDAPVIVANVCSTGEELARYLDAFADPAVTACLDVGHAGLVGLSADRMVRALGAERLTCLHVHDNDFLHDSHTYPFVMNVNFAELMRALREIGYRGDLTFEASSFLRRLPDELCFDATVYLCRIGKYLRTLFEA